ncbi:hypothetical protein EV207_1647 [Scopulibacillus darangshiensis]|uniref:Uncharacterized protein n=1 Tax=Scopulibacillus darangshiensis TaxID=442528 RepID=A0A4R2NDH4_9BACL|nr:hypothetical protein EV207_1647 [Scopulibacillus darangshiensis]
MWSFALPGFGQFLNGKFLKGIVFLILEFVINVQSNFNEVIKVSFHGQIEKAIHQTHYEWLMFYPCLYFFAAWDAYRDDGNEKKPYLFLPFVFVAYSVTVGVIYSPSLEIMGVLLGPVWLPILFIIPGISVGVLIRYVVVKCFKK